MCVFVYVCVCVRVCVCLSVGVHLGAYCRHCLATLRALVMSLCVCVCVCVCVCARECMCQRVFCVLKKKTLRLNNTSQ